MKIKDIIGVERGETFGICHYQKPQTVVRFFTTNYHDFCEWVAAELSPETHRFVVEDPTRKKALYDRGFEQQLTQYAYKRDVENILKTMRMIAKIAQNVGQVKETTDNPHDRMAHPARLRRSQGSSRNAEVE